MQSVIDAQHSYMETLCFDKHVKCVKALNVQCYSKPVNCDRHKEFMTGCGKLSKLRNIACLALRRTHPMNLHIRQFSWYNDSKVMCVVYTPLFHRVDLMVIAWLTQCQWSKPAVWKSQIDWNRNHKKTRQSASNHTSQVTMEISGRLIDFEGGS